MSKQCKMIDPGGHVLICSLAGYGTIRAKTSSSLGRFDRDDSRKKSNGTVRAEKLGRFAQNQI